MNKKFLAVTIGLSVSISLLAVALSTSVASADEAAPQSVHVTKTVTVYGKRQLPSVVIEIARLSAAHEASVAHDSLRAALVEQSKPAALRDAK